MKIQFSNNEIRIRISQAEFETLKISAEFNSSLEYLALAVKLKVVAAPSCGTINPREVQLFLTADDLAFMEKADSKKVGVKLLLQQPNGIEIAADVQVDLHSKKD